YTDWDCTGAYLLTYALPLKSLYLTGKKPCSVPPLNPKEVADVIAAGRDYFSATGKNGFSYDGRTTEQLLAGLSSWSPTVRKRSSQTLGQREDDFVPPLLKLLAGSDRYSRYGACEALGCLGQRADVAAPQLRALLKDPDPWMESLACNAIARLGPEARKAAANDLLALAACKNAADPRRMSQRAVANALFEPYPGSGGPQGILAGSLSEVDRRLLYPAIQSVLENDDGAARLTLARYYERLTDRDLAALLPAIVKATEKLAPSDEMFADVIRLAGLDVLSRLHIREGMPLCVSTIEMTRWGDSARIPACLKCLARYGVHAKALLPQLREMARGASKDRQEFFNKSIAEIEAATDSPTLVNLKDFIAKASASGDALKNTRKGTP
ncbi:MAG: HEAT repeat domain-containing protein, partial [Verrucomicrobia bacterium]|nr:HEAT repeat domain-containing protein [Verrucomicrobiota bacterium]